MKLSGIDEQQLIELIEGDLTGADAERLRADIIRRDPGLAARIAAMQRDRQMLRRLPPVDPPMDFLTELEPQIARPMLMDEAPSAPVIITKPGAARRAAQREHRRAQLIPAAVAAGIVIMLAGGLWYMFQHVDILDRTRVVATGGDGNTNTQIAVESDETPPFVDALAGIAGDAELHHKLPPVNQMLAASATESQNSSNGGLNSDRPMAAIDEPQFVVADFQLLIETADDDAPIVLAGAIEPLTGRAAVVRNLTVENLKRIEAVWMASRAGVDNNTPLRTETNGTNNSLSGSMGGSALRGSFTLNVDMLRESADKLIESGLVAGEPALMPQYSTQIELSESGAVYTIVLPVGEMQSLLQQLASVHGVESAMLVMRETEAANYSGEASDINSSVGGASRWISDLAGVQRNVAELSQSHHDAMVVLPIVVVSD